MNPNEQVDGMETTPTHASQPLPDADRLSELQLFSGVGLESIEVYLERCTTRLLAAGDVLLHPDGDNSTVYALLDGHVDVHLDDPSLPPLCTLGPGACVGEMSIIENKNPSAYVIAATPTRVLELSHEILWSLVNSSHAFARNLLVVLSERVRSDNSVIVDNHSALREYERNAMTDALTDLNNRHWLEEMYRREIQRCQLDGAPLCLAMLDIDFFKSFNDEFGHIAGDHALITVADALRSHFRPTDMIARYGGDEFVILLPDTDLGQAEGIAERVRKAIGGDAPAGEGADRTALTVSLGLTEMGHSDTMETLLNNADAALYRAKLAGRNCVSA